MFTTSIGTPLQSRNLILRHLKPLLKVADIPETVRLYDLRHSTATLLLTLGVHPKVVQEMLEHADIKMTLDTYSHVLPTLTQDAAKKLADLFSGRG
ncbi:tyrosine-type recombinase/integrase [Alicyclobacillus sp. ALC3]|nr:tyrosine-type recombinase/integrase [Alicyclobacillus sp. ALC3]